MSAAGEDYILKAMIMAAGVGSRLMPLTSDVPKPMIPMANRPLMESIVELLSEHGITEVIANLHYHADSIANHFGESPRPGMKMIYSREDELMGTAGGVKKCQWFLDDTFVVMSGDALTDVDLTSLIQEHRLKGALATIAVKTVDEVEEFGVVVSDADDRITSFQEKPTQEEALSNQANTGIYIFEPEIFDFIPARQFYDFGKQVFPHLVKIKAPFYVAVTDDYWCDVGNLDTYRQAHFDVLQGKVRYAAAGTAKRTDTARVLIGEGAVIEEDVQLSGNVVIGAGCHIGRGALLKECILWDQVQVGVETQLQGCILGTGCQVGRQSQLGEGTVIGSGCQIKAKSILGNGHKASQDESGQLRID
jgi:mannose-1-phosphate guanylyltransferase